MEASSLLQWQGRDKRGPDWRSAGRRQEGQRGHGQWRKHSKPSLIRHKHSEDDGCCSGQGQDGVGFPRTELARREERERKIRAEQDANRKARRGTVTDEERRRVHLGRLHATRTQERAEDRAQL